MRLWSNRSTLVRPASSISAIYVGFCKIRSCCDVITDSKGYNNSQVSDDDEKGDEGRRNAARQTNGIISAE
ncbi:hypothetical protein QE152_g36099 [Popillia japonica]|uniref:Uncharacterized protein n=1 Tax=Popillia japonica TaxID=7064 RepID=A0AAW1IDT8_POPJA